MDRKCSNCGSPMIRTSNGYKCTFCSYVEPFNQTNKGYEPPKPNVPRNYRSDQFSGNNLKEFSNIAEKKKRGNKFIMGFVVAIFAAVFILRIISTIATYTLYDGYFETEKADSTYDEDYDTDVNAVTGELSTVKEEYWIQSPVMKQAVEDMFGKPFEEITKQDVETVRYMAVETSSAHGWCQISYSFEDYKDYLSQELNTEVFPYNEEFLQTIQTKTYTLNDRTVGDIYDDIHNFSGVTGLDLQYYDIDLSGFSNLTYLKCGSEDMAELVEAGFPVEQIEVLELNNEDDFSALTRFSGLKKLYIDYCQVEDLEYIAKCQSLNTLYCMYLKGTKSIDDLGNLQELKTLYVAGTSDGLKNLDAIGELKNLENLAIVDTDILTIDFLENMTGLKTLWLVGNGELRDYSALGSLVNLEYLDFNLDDLNGEQPDYTSIGNLKNLKHLSLTVVYNLDFLYELNNLEELEIDICFYNNLLEPIRKMSQLKTLKLANCNSQYLDGFACLQELSQLKSLTIEGMEFNDAVDGLFQLTNLEELHFISCQFYTAPSTIAANPNLKVLEMSSVEFVTMPGPDSEYYYVGYNDEEINQAVLNSFAACTGLEELYLSRYLVKDLSFLQGLTALKVLSMPACEITAIDNQTLAACTELEQLNLADNTVSSLDFVAGLANLKSVNIENCYVSDLLPLTFCEHLEYVNVKGNPISSNPLENVEVEE